jgi:hypothetical protein
MDFTDVVTYNRNVITQYLALRMDQFGAPVILRIPLHNVVGRIASDALFLQASEQDEGANSLFRFPQPVGGNQNLLALQH